MKIASLGLGSRLAICTLFSLQLIGQGRSPHQEPKRRVVRSQRLTQDNVNRLVLAIQDEVYDYGQQKSFYRIGITSGQPSHAVTELLVYVRPFIDKDGAGEAIYKNMPYGEVLRVFHIRTDGVVVLDNDPEQGFPITQPSHLTLFMDDGELCMRKKTWLRQVFLIEDNPSQARIEEAARRQKGRSGFSDWEYRQGKSERVIR